MTDTAPGWYSDALGRHELRYWDGAHWTEHVSSHGRQSLDPADVPARTVEGRQSREKVRQQVRRQAGLDEPRQWGGCLFSEPVLVVNQKAKLIEVNNEYAIYDQHGDQIGAVRQVGQSRAKKVMRVLTSFDQFMTHKLQVVAADGTVVLAVTRPAKVVRSRVLIQDGAGKEIGEVVQDNVFGKIRFSFMVGGERVGAIGAENWRAWNFTISDADGNEVARITKTWEGLAKTLFTSADNYVLQIHRPLAEPLRSLVVASALTVDTALKQDSRGLG